MLKGLSDAMEYKIKGILVWNELMKAGIQLDQVVSGSLQGGEFTSQIFKLLSLSLHNKK